MKITYAISYRDFVAVQPPLLLRAGRNASFRILQAVCVFLGLIGLGFVAQDLGLIRRARILEGGDLRTGILLVGLAVLGAVAGFFLDQRSVDRKKRKHAENLALAFSRIHCRDERAFEAGDDNYIASCKCGTVIRPWSELKSFSENNALLILQGNTEGHFIPKSAFATEGDLTEFRNLILEKLRTNRPLTARRAEYVFTKDDFNSASRLHIWKGGGWRYVLGTLATSGFALYGIFVLALVGSRGGPLSLVVVLVLAPLVTYGIFRFRSRRRYLGPQRIFYSDEGLHLEDPTAQARMSWDRFIGYLEGQYVFLLYSTPQRYRIVPKRGFADSGREFRVLLETKLPVFNYRRPFPKVTPA